MMKSRASRPLQYQTFDVSRRFNTITGNSYVRTPSISSGLSVHSYNTKINMPLSKDRYTTLYTPKSNTPGGLYLRPKTDRENKPIESHNFVNFSAATLTSNKENHGEIHKVSKKNNESSDNRRTERLQNPLSEIELNTLKSQCLSDRSNNINENYDIKSSCEISIPNYKPARYSLKGNGIVKAYAVNTNKGLIR